MEAHDGELRALCLTANGTLLATASIKGTIIRVWDIATSSCTHEFRRGVERATITCLAFSWDDQWISCCSDKGTVHIFHKEEEPKDDKNENKSTFSKLLGTTSRPKPKSVCQIRGIPHPLACAFVGDASNMLAVSGWDADGNGVLLVSEFAAQQEARRVAYHVLVRNSVEETEEERRRRRARGWKPKLPDTPDNDFGNLMISEPIMNHLSTRENDDDDFCEVVVNQPIEPVIDDKAADSVDISTAQSVSVNNKDESETKAITSDDDDSNPKDPVSTSQQDSLQTEPLEEFLEAIQ